MSPNEEKSTDVASDVTRLNLLAEMSGSADLGLDVKDLEEIIKCQDEIRAGIDELERDLKILVVA
jgi:hypothetical protein